MRILEPIQVGKVTFKNRIMFPPLTTGYEEKDGSISPQCIAFYERLAMGGTGYIVLGDVVPVRTFSPTPKLYNDSQIEGYKKLAAAVHQYGAKIGLQIFHPEYEVEIINQLFAAGDYSKLREKLHYDMKHYINEVSTENLQIIIDKLCDCALRAQKAGIDVIQIHGDRLVGSLSSKILNQRRDEFGGSLENRTRFAIMLVKAIKNAVPDMTIDYKLAIITPERGKGGVNEEEAIIFAKWLEEAGVDMLHVAQANHTGNMADTIPPMGIQPYGFFAAIAGKIKEQVSIPVSTVGRILNPKLAESIIEGGKADMVALGRSLLADPDWANKAAEGKTEDIRQCIMCNKGCTGNIQNRKFLSCVLNAENGHELHRKIVPAAVRKNVYVIGGGPAGLEAARVAASKGHQVTLFEKGTKLGGQLNIASLPPRKGEIRRAITYLTHAAQSKGVTFRMGSEITEQEILENKPDAVILACGAENMIPRIPGFDRANVCDAWKVLDSKQQVFGKVVVIGGGMVGCETAEYLCKEFSCDVTIVEMLDTIAKGESSTVLPTLMDNFKNHGVAIYTGNRVMEITEKSVICQDNTGKSKEIPCDFVVFAVGARSVDFPINNLEAAGIQVVKAGDCKNGASDIENAIKTGYDAANML